MERFLGEVCLFDGDFIIVTEPPTNTICHNCVFKQTTNVCFYSKFILGSCSPRSPIRNYKRIIFKEWKP